MTTHEDEYTGDMIAAMDLIWGEGFMAPGGEGNVEQMVRGLDLSGKRVLDIGCGQGRSACYLAARFGATVVGTDLEAHLIRRARQRAARDGLDQRVHFREVAPGPLDFPDASFDVITISGALTQIEDKLGMYQECLRVLKPRGELSCYDWMKPPGAISADMRYWFELEGLTYALAEPEEHKRLLARAGYSSIRLRDKSDWYRVESQREYERMCGPLKQPLVSILGEAETDHFIEDWRMLTRLCKQGELLQVYTRATKPAVEVG